MSKLLCLIVVQFMTVMVLSQSVFYVKIGNNISKVENADPSKLKVVEWQVRLYKNGSPTTGNAYWGNIKGNSVEEVMSKLKSSQEFELRFNEFVGKGKVQDPILTYFNPLGPIAIIDQTEEISPSSTNGMKTYNEYFDKAKEYFKVYIEAKENIDKILKPKPSTPFDNTGAVFTEYSKNLYDAFTYVNSLRNLLGNNYNTKMELISNLVNKIDKKFDATNNSKDKLYAAINNPAQIESEDKLDYKKSNTNSLNNIVSKIPLKYKSPILQTLDYSWDNVVQVVTKKDSPIPENLTIGLNEQQIIYFKEFVREAYNYVWDIGYSFALLSQGSIGYGHFNNQKVVFDDWDQYYRENVLKNDRIFETDNYNVYYTGALLSKASVAYSLFQLLKADPTSNKEVKSDLLNYGLITCNMVYEQYIDGYPKEYNLKRKQELINKFKENLK